MRSHREQPEAGDRAAGLGPSGLGPATPDAVVARSAGAAPDGAAIPTYVGPGPDVIANGHGPRPERADGHAGQFDGHADGHDLDVSGTSGTPASLWPLLVILIGLTISAAWSVGLLWALYAGLRWMLGS